MKFRELTKLLSIKDSLKLSLMSSIGLCLLIFIIGSLLILLGGNSPVTLGGEKVGGLKGFLALLAFTPFYVLFFTLIQFFILVIGLWISRLFFKLKKQS